MNDNCQMHVVKNAHNYVIKAGDTLWSIAEQIYGDGSKCKEIEQCNDNIDANNLQIGQTINLPSSSNTSNAKPNSSASSNIKNEGQYTIKKGDTLWLIAEHIYGDGSKFKDIQQCNDNIDPNNLQIGQTIYLP